METVKVEDGYEFIERDPKNDFEVVGTERLETFEGRRAARSQS